MQIIETKTKYGRQFRRFILFFFRTINITLQQYTGTHSPFLVLAFLCFCFGVTSILTNTNITFHTLWKIWRDTKICIKKFVLYIRLHLDEEENKSKLMTKKPRARNYEHIQTLIKISYLNFDSISYSSNF